MFRPIGVIRVLECGECGVNGGIAEYSLIMGCVFEIYG